MDLSSHDCSQSLCPSQMLCEKMAALEEERNSGCIVASDDLNERSWSNLPYDLLEQIAFRLAFIQLLSFRSTCKPWRLASSKASGECTHASNTDRRAWFLLYGNDSNCCLYDNSSEKMYNIEFPELYGADCIASRGGWLLVYRGGSIFFFCPFSRAKIDLPKFPHEELLNHIATFSSAPTSPDCVVCIGTKISKTMLELNVLRRGASEWVNYNYDGRIQYLNHVLTSAVLCNDILYLLDSKLMLMRFSLQDEKWKVHTIVPYGVKVNQSLIVGTLPFLSRREACTDKIKQKLGLKDSDSLTTCGAYIQGNDKNNICIHNEDIQGKQDGDKELSHKKKGVWIQPRFFQLPANQTWSL